MAYGTGLFAQFQHSGLVEARELSPLVHWLRDATLALPVAMIAALAAWRLVARAPRPSSFTWAFSAAGLFLALSVPGNYAHAWLFGAQHGGESHLMHALQDVVPLSASALPLAAVVALLFKSPARAPRRAIIATVRRA